MTMVRTFSLILALFTAACDSSAAPPKGRASGGRDGQATGERRDNEQGHDDRQEGIVVLQPEAAAHIDIRTALVESRPLDAVLSTTGRVDFNENRLAHVSPRVRGRVHEVRALLGQSVRAGEVLLVVDSIELGQAKSEYLQAKAQLDLTRRTLEREKGLLSDKITSEQAVLEARAANQQALAAFQAAAERLKLLGLSDEDIDRVHYNDPSAPLFSLRSPIDGTVIEKRASLGDMLRPDKGPYTVADLTTLWIWIDVYERNLAGVHLDDDVEVTVSAYPARSFKGKVTYIRSEVDPDTRTARARITVENPHGHLKPGMFASITVTDPHRPAGDTKSLVVPTSAVQRYGAQSVAFVEIGRNRYQLRVLTLGRRAAGFIEVRNGLAAGESVVTEGAFILKSEAAKETIGGEDGD